MNISFKLLSRWISFSDDGIQDMFVYQPAVIMLVSKEDKSSE